MFGRLKRALYFPLAGYFRLFAKVQLLLWKPRIVVITGSSGKTTLLHLLQSQIGDSARYSHHANSAFGVSFDILGLKRKELARVEWFSLFLLAPIRAFKKPFSEKLYIVEADCDRPGEGKFLAGLLKPEVTLWVSVSRTHSANFDALVPSKFKTVDEAIAFEFGYFAQNSSGEVFANGDPSLITEQLKRAPAKKTLITKKELQSYRVSATGTEFKTKNGRFAVKALLPEEAFYSLSMTKGLLEYLNLKFNPTFPGFELPPGRSSLFKGIKNTTLLDSSYNATLDGMKATLKMFDSLEAKTKWAVLGDMIEQGKEEEEEHQKLAAEILKYKFAKIILMGPRVSKYTFSMLANSQVVAFTTPKEALDYLSENLKGGETILFKGARFLEGVVEALLLNKADIKLLCRREKVWQERRRKWGV